MSGPRVGSIPKSCGKELCISSASETDVNVSKFEDVRQIVNRFHDIAFAKNSVSSSLVQRLEVRVRLTQQDTVQHMRVNISNPIDIVISEFSSSESIQNWTKIKKSIAYLGTRSLGTLISLNARRFFTGTRVERWIRTTSASKHLSFKTRPRVDFPLRHWILRNSLSTQQHLLDVEYRRDPRQERTPNTLMIFASLRLLNVSHICFRITSRQLGHDFRISTRTSMTIFEAETW